MLDLIRKKQKSVIIKVVFWGIIATFIGTIFLVWGKGRDGSGGSGGPVAATVNGAVISDVAYQTYYNNLYDQVKMAYGGGQVPEALLKQFNLEEQSLNTLIERELLRQEAERRDIEVSRQEVIDSIATIPYFQENGAFSKDRYVALLQAQRISPEQFEADQRESLRIEKLTEQVQADIEITPDEIEAEYRRRNDKVRLEVLRFEPGNFTGKVTVETEALETFYAGEREAYRVPDKIALAYLTFKAADFVAEATVSEAELEKVYRRNRGSYEVPEEVHAAHILIKVPANADAKTREAKRAKIDEIRAKAVAGEDFAALAKRYSEDSTRNQGGDLGFFPRGRMYKPFEDAAFALADGALSEVVTTQDGFHVIKVLEHHDARVKELDEVRDEVTAAAKQQKAVQLAYEKALDAYNLNRKEGSIEKAAADFGATLETTALFTRGEAIPGLGNKPEISGTAFTLAKGELARPVRDGDTTYLVSVAERIDTYIPELAKVRAPVEKAYRAVQARVLAEQAAGDALAALKEGKALKDVSRASGGLLRTTEPFSHANGDIIPGLGSSEALAAEAFALTPEAPLAPEVYTVGGTYVVAVLKESTPADMSSLDDAKREELRSALVEQKKADNVKDLLATLRDQAEIVINIQFNRG